MTNEQTGKKRGRPKKSKNAEAAERLRELMEVKPNDFQGISRTMEAEGLPGLAVPTEAPPQEDLMGAIAMTKGDIIDRVVQAETAMAARTREAIETVQDIGETTRQRVGQLDERVTTLTTQVGLLTQLLQKLDPGRIDQAVESLQAARSQYEAPPLRQTVREAAEAIRSGDRPPRRKLGVTVDGSLWAAVEEVQRRQRCTISDILDRALKIWLDHEGQA